MKAVRAECFKQSWCVMECVVFVSDELYGDFEDLETGERHTAADKEDEDKDNGSDGNEDGGEGE